MESVQSKSWGSRSAVGWEPCGKSWKIRGKKEKNGRKIPERNGVKFCWSWGGGWKEKPSQKRQTKQRHVMPLTQKNKFATKTYPDSFTAFSDFGVHHFSRFRCFSGIVTRTYRCSTRWAPSSYRPVSRIITPVTQLLRPLDIRVVQPKFIPGSWGPSCTAQQQKQVPLPRSLSLEKKNPWPGDNPEVQT